MLPLKKETSPTLKAFLESQEVQTNKVTIRQPIDMTVCEWLTGRRPTKKTSVSLKKAQRKLS